MGILHGVFFQENINDSSLLFYVFCTASMNGSFGNISGFCFITVIGFQAHYTMFFRITLMVLLLPLLVLSPFP